MEPFQTQILELFFAWRCFDTALLGAVALYLILGSVMALLAVAVGVPVLDVADCLVIIFVGLIAAVVPQKFVLELAVGAIGLHTVSIVT